MKLAHPLFQSIAVRIPAVLLTLLAVTAFTSSFAQVLSLIHI